MTKIEISPALHAGNPLHNAVTSAFSKSDQEDTVPDERFMGPFPKIEAKQHSFIDSIESNDVNAVDPSATQPVTMDDIEQWAEKIKECLTRTVGEIVKVGTLLLEAKKALPYGSYYKMVSENLPFKKRQAQYYTRIAQNAVLSNAQNAEYLPRSVTQLSLLARLRNDDLMEILADVQDRLANGEDINTDSPKLWAGYRNKYLIPALPEQPPEIAPDNPSAEPGQVPTTPPSAPTEDSKEDIGTNTNEKGCGSGADQKTVPPEPEKGVTAESTVPTPSDQGNGSDPPQDGEAETKGEPKEKDDSGIQRNAPGDPEKNEAPAEGQGQQPAKNKDVKDIEKTHFPEVPDPNSLTAEDKAEGEFLYQWWITQIAPLWNKYPIKSRLIMLKWLYFQVIAEANPERQAA